MLSAESMVEGSSGSWKMIIIIVFFFMLNWSFSVGRSLENKLNKLKKRGPQQFVRSQSNLEVLNILDPVLLMLII